MPGTPPQPLPVGCQRARCHGAPSPLRPAPSARAESPPGWQLLQPGYGRITPAPRALVVRASHRRFAPLRSAPRACSAPRTRARRGEPPAQPAGAGRRRPCREGVAHPAAGATASPRPARNRMLGAKLTDRHKTGLNRTGKNGKAPASTASDSAFRIAGCKRVSPQSGPVRALKPGRIRNHLPGDPGHRADGLNSGPAPPQGPDYVTKQQTYLGRQVVGPGGQRCSQMWARAGPHKYLRTAIGRQVAGPGGQICGVPVLLVFQNLPHVGHHMGPYLRTAFGRQVVGPGSPEVFSSLAMIWAATHGQT